MSMRVLKKLKKFVLFSGVFFMGISLFGEETPVKNVYEYKLKNGLELFVAENHTVPLVYIEVAVKGGGIAQTEQNQGLFHLYEHMMFKSNSLYKSYEEIQNALSNLGVASWNGSTGIEYVNYYFTIPADKLEEGLRFWQAALCTPALNKKELEVEKKVVISEIEGDNADESQKLRNFIAKKMFPDAPWSYSPGGLSVDVIKNATASQLKKIQSEYYIPNNAALFVGGDVNPDEVYSLVEKIWGKWKKGKDPWIQNNAHYSQNPLDQIEYYVMPYNKISEQVAQFMYINRGPDSEYDVESTYSADILLNLISYPHSNYKYILSAKQNLGIPGPEYTGCSYLTERRNSMIQNIAVVVSPEQYLPQRAKLYSQLIPDLIFDTIPDDEETATQKIGLIKQGIMNDRIYSMETSTGILSDLRYWWIQADQNYYFDYVTNMEKQTIDDLKKITNEYIYKRNPLVIVLVNPQVYEIQKDSFKDEGFVVIE